MNKYGRWGIASLARVTRALALMAALGLSLVAAGCGGEEKSSGQALPRATGYSADLKKTLEYDDRVLSSSEEGRKLVVMVNEKWEPTDKGNKAWALGGWFEKWQRQHGDGKNSDGLEVVVRFNGKDLDRYTARGYEPIEEKKEN
jgi:hypothetical protein